MSTEDIYGLTFGVLVLTLVTIVAVVVIWQGLASWRAIKVASREEVYRKLAEDLAETMRAINSRQEAMQRDVAQLKEQGARVEKLLRQVE
jgi:hypothetical protein